MSKRVVIVKSNKKPTRKPRKPHFSFPVGVECNVKVQGQRTMMKHVRLVPLDGSKDRVKVLTGHRGRPAVLSVSQIERVRPL